MCKQAEEIWLSFQKEINALGFKTGFCENKRRLAKSLKINASPVILGFINGIQHEFKGEISLNRLHDFALNLIPANIVNESNDKESLTRLLNNADEENKVLAVLVTRSVNRTLNFLMPCFKLSDNIKCATSHIGLKTFLIFIIYI